MGKPRQPAAPDPVALTNAQADANTRTAQEQQRLNMVSSSGPNGTVRWEADPSAPGGYRQVTELGGVNQQINNVAGQQIGRVGDALGRTLNTDGLPALQGMDDATRQRYEDAAYQGATRRLDQQYGAAESGLDAKLAAQGLGENSSATRTLRQDFARDRTDAYGEAQRNAVQQGLQAGVTTGTFNNEARGQGLQERAYVQNQPINQLGALLSGGQVSAPQGFGYTPTSVGQTDTLGANALSLNQQNQNYSTASANRNGLLGGLFQLGGAAIGASDRRLKRDIKRVGTLANGLPVYEYRYVWGRKRHTGVMAQDVLKAGIDAVVRHWTGFLMVDYGKL